MIASAVQVTTATHHVVIGRIQLPLGMHMQRLSALFACLLLSVVAHAQDALPSWSDSQSKQAILNFVAKTTQKTSPSFIQPSERIAVFDHDGTLWSEQPMYVQLAFALDRIKALAPAHPHWQTTQPFQAALENDLTKLMLGGEKGLMQIIAASHAGMTTEAFSEIVANWLKTARHPKTGRLYTEMVYQPMLEVLTHLRQHGFKTYIVSGGGVEFMRPWVEAVYGIPPEQVIGSSIKTELVMMDGVTSILRLPQINFIDDKEGKPIAINQHIGRRPVIAFGNSDGDLQMLQWTSDRDRDRSLGVIIHHTDANREVAYDRLSPIGKLDKALEMAEHYGWVIVDMKADWTRIFPEK